MEDENKNCITCGKEDSRTGKPCPTRKDCFFPNYKNWEDTIGMEVQTVIDWIDPVDDLVGAVKQIQGFLNEKFAR